MTDLTIIGGQAATVPTREMVAAIHRVALIMDGEAPHSDAARHLELVIGDALETMGSMSLSSWNDSPTQASNERDRVVRNLASARGLLARYPDLSTRAHQMFSVVQKAGDFLSLMGMFSAAPSKVRSRGDTETYLVLHPGTGLIKIGRTTDIRKRLAALQCGAGQPLAVLGVIPGDVERELHIRFAGLRVHGEWFEDRNGLISAYAKSVGTVPDSVQASEPQAEGVSQ